jgi:hypothetical protein
VHVPGILLARVTCRSCWKQLGVRLLGLEFIELHMVDTM